MSVTLTAATATVIQPHVRRLGRSRYTLGSPDDGTPQCQTPAAAAALTGKE
jgi:hypothetical protein